MKKCLKGLLTLVLSFILVGSSLLTVDAYTQSYEMSGDIIMNYIEEGKDKNVALKGTLKNNAAKVYNQEVAIDKSEYDAYVKIANDAYAYKESRASKKDELWATRNAKSQALEGLTEGTDAYNTALADFNAANQAYSDYDSETIAKVKEYEEQQKKLVPDPAYDKWNELKLDTSKSTDTQNIYPAEVTGDNAYYFVWIKVVVDGKEYYAYSPDCLPDTVVLPKCKIEGGKYYNNEGKEVSEEEYNKACSPSCKIVNDKYYDNNGKEVSEAEYEKACGNPQTGNNVYYTYGIITIIAAFGLYIATRKVKKLSK